MISVTLGFATFALIIMVYSHALSFAAGQDPLHNWRDDMGSIVGLVALAAAFCAGLVT